MNAKQNLELSEELKAKIAQAKKVSEVNGKTFVAALFRTIAREKNVRVLVPGQNAKYLNFIKGHEIAVFENESFAKLLMIAVKDHYVHGDFPLRSEEGKVSPRVIRHFCAYENALGKEIVADVEVKEKTCLLTGKKTIIVDIAQLPEGNYESKHVLRLGVASTGQKNEVPIYETNLCVLIDEAPAKVMSGLNPPTQTPIQEVKKVDEAPVRAKPKLVLKKNATNTVPEKKSKPDLFLRPKLKLVKRS